MNSPDNLPGLSAESPQFPSVPSSPTGLAAPDPTVDVERPPGGTINILLVDDDPDDVFLTRQTLESTLSCRIDVAVDGAEALRRLAAGTDYHVILLDNGLPDMPGLDVLAELRSQSRSVPVILVTGFGGESTVVEAMRRGANDYVVKTGDYLQVIPEVVTQVIERERVRRRAEHLEGEHLRFARLAAIGEMAAGIAHEIRNPMTVIAGMASLIRENHSALETADLEQCAQSIVDSCAHLNRVLEEILQNAQQTQAHEPLELRQVISETLSFMRFDMEWRNYMEVQTNYDTPGHIMGSRNQIKQVLINLFRNASQAVQMASKRRGHVAIRLYEDKEKSEAVVTITDDGLGIEPDVLPHIFESGFSTKQPGSKVEGTGLGLSICRRIVEGHSGQMWAESNDFGGATFYIALPLHFDK